MKDLYQHTPQDFDRTDPKNTGRPNYFNLDMFLAVTEQLIISDEVETAFWMLDNLPGWYRDNVPYQVIKMREQLHRKLFTPIEYSKIECKGSSLFRQEKSLVRDSIFASLPRAQQVRLLVKQLNDQGETPHIIEMGPGSYFIPHGLSADNLKFTYFGEGLNSKDNDEAFIDIKEWREVGSSKVNIFISFEIIEHLHNPSEIYQYSLKHNLDFDYIYLSTPLYTWGGGNPNWWNADLGHLRTYTPSELLSFAKRYWPNYDWTTYLGSEIHLEGKRQ